jgi:hypothetical protein
VVAHSCGGIVATKGVKQLLGKKSKKIERGEELCSGYHVYVRVPVERWAELGGCVWRLAIAVY